MEPTMLRVSSSATHGARKGGLGNAEQLRSESAAPTWWGIHGPRDLKWSTYGPSSTTERSVGGGVRGKLIHLRQSGDSGPEI